VNNRIRSFLIIPPVDTPLKRNEETGTYYQKFTVLLPSISSMLLAR
jgi:hypothetical protein